MRKPYAASRAARVRASACDKRGEPRQIGVGMTGSNQRTQRCQSAGRPSPVAGLPGDIAGAVVHLTSVREVVDERDECATELTAEDSGALAAAIAELRFDFALARAFFEATGGAGFRFADE